MLVTFVGSWFRAVQGDHTWDEVGAKPSLKQIGQIRHLAFRVAIKSFVPGFIPWKRAPCAQEHGTDMNQDYLAQEEPVLEDP